ncbi:dienelactone hydrolase family protein [Candidatus Peregrinibacteria bacterium]|nr:dienelactone hydrolase family protein [Candidatus Peregrinibacteria bacterium]
MKQNHKNSSGNHPRLFAQWALTALMLATLSGCSLYGGPKASPMAPSPAEHIGCQEREIDQNGKCVPATDNNAGLFGQNLDPFVETSTITEGNLGFLAKPKTPGIYPGVVMIHEWWGLNDNIKEMAKILAKEGYVVLAVDLYNGQVATDSAKAMELSGAVQKNPQAALDQMKKAVQYLRTDEKAPKIASLGWCFGGGQSLQLALNDTLDATVIYYGQLTDDKAKLGHIQWPVLGNFGEKDTNISVASVESFKSALTELGIQNQITIYPGVGHAFANPSGSNYAKNETLDAWQKTVDFLKANLKSTTQAKDAKDAVERPDSEKNQAKDESEDKKPTPPVVKPTPKPVPPTSANASKKTFAITGEPFKFLMNGAEAPVLRVKQGDTVRIEFTNTKGFHDWVLDEFNARTPQLQAGASATVEFVADKKGTFEYYCSVGSHRAMGMKGNLIVE